MKWYKVNRWFKMKCESAQDLFQIYQLTPLVNRMLQHVRKLFHHVFFLGIYKINFNPYYCKFSISRTIRYEKGQTSRRL